MCFLPSFNSFYILSSWRSYSKLSLFINTAFVSLSLAACFQKLASSSLLTLCNGRHILSYFVFETYSSSRWHNRVLLNRFYSDGILGVISAGDILDAGGVNRGCLVWISELDQRRCMFQGALRKKLTNMDASSRSLRGIVAEQTKAFLIVNCIGKRAVNYWLVYEANCTSGLSSLREKGPIISNIIIELKVRHRRRVSRLEQVSPLKCFSPRHGIIGLQFWIPRVLHRRRLSINTACQSSFCNSGFVFRLRLIIDNFPDICFFCIHHDSFSTASLTFILRLNISHRLYRTIMLCHPNKLSISGKPFWCDWIFLRVS